MSNSIIIAMLSCLIRKKMGIKQKHIDKSGNLQQEHMISRREESII